MKSAEHASPCETDDQRYSVPVRIFAGDPHEPTEVGVARFDFRLGAWVEPDTLQPLNDGKLPGA
jgi:hypothetical protein